MKMAISCFFRSFDICHGFFFFFFFLLSDRSFLDFGNGATSLRDTSHEHQEDGHDDAHYGLSYDQARRYHECVEYL